MNWHANLRTAAALLAALAFAALCFDVDRIVSRAEQPLVDSAQNVEAVTGNAAALTGGALPALTGFLDGTRSDVLGLTQRQLDATRSDAMRLFGNTLGVTNARVGDALGRVDFALDEVDGLRKSLDPVLANAAITEASASRLLDVYAMVPSRLENSSSWMALEPEITCRDVAGGGYGGCWHARITGLLGEAANVGGVFTQKFPALSDAVVSTSNSVAGIGKDVQEFADKYIDPKPLTFKQKIWAGFKFVFGGAETAARAGLLDTYAPFSNLPPLK